MNMTRVDYLLLKLNRDTVLWALTLILVARPSRDEVPIMLRFDESLSNSNRDDVHRSIHPDGFRLSCPVVKVPTLRLKTDAA